MALRCLFGFHRPALNTIVRRADGFAALCDGCGRVLAKGADGKWRVPDAADRPLRP